MSASNFALGGAIVLLAILEGPQTIRHLDEYFNGNMSSGTYSSSYEGDTVSGTPSLPSYDSGPLYMTPQSPPLFQTDPEVVNPFENVPPSATISI